MTTVAITSFGYLHGQEPVARVCYDLRHQFRDPHLRRCAARTSSCPWSTWTPPPGPRRAW